MDIFPQNRSGDVERLNYNFDYWIKHKSRVTALTSFKQHERIFHQRREDWLQGRKEMQHFNYCLRSAKSEGDFRPDELNWEKVDNRLSSKSPLREDMQNSDMRTCFTLDNMFLVKCGFTFGHWLVNPGDKHIIQTSQSPMVIYQMKSEFAKKCCTTRRTLVPIDQSRYDRFVLCPHEIYFIPEGTRYILMAAKKTIFAVDVIDADQELPGALSFKKHRKYEPTTFDVPPPTPAPHMPCDQDKDIPRPKDKSKDKSRLLKKSRGHDWNNFKIPRKKNIVKQDSVAMRHETFVAEPTHRVPAVFSQEAQDIPAQGAPAVFSQEAQGAPTVFQQQDVPALFQAQDGPAVFPQEAQGAPAVFPQEAQGAPAVFQQEAQGAPAVFRVPQAVFPQPTYGAPAMFPQQVEFRVPPAVFPQPTYGAPAMFPQQAHQLPPVLQQAHQLPPVLQQAQRGNLAQDYLNSFDEWIEQPVESLFDLDFDTLMFEDDPPQDEPMDLTWKPQPEKPQPDLMDLCML